MKQSVNGQQIEYIRRGSGEPMLFIHGNPDTSHLWEDMIDQLDDNYLCIAPDLPGYGGSDIQSSFDFSLAGLAQFIDDFVTALNLEEPVHLVVHDVGAFFGLSWAVEHSAKVRSITIFNTAYNRNYRWHKLGKIWRTPLIGELSLALMDERKFVGGIRRMAPKLPKASIVKSYRSISKKTKRTILKLYRAASPSVFKGWDKRLQSVVKDVPTQVIWGRHDPFIGKEISETFGTDRITYLEDYGHWVPAEAPEKAVELMRSFLTVNKAH